VGPADEEKRRVLLLLGRRGEEGGRTQNPPVKACRRACARAEFSAARNASGDEYASMQIRSKSSFPMPAGRQRKTDRQTTEKTKKQASK
jgi:hypothetical protein